MKKVFFVFFLISLGLFSAPNLIQSSNGIVPCELGECRLCDFFVMIERIVKFFLIPDGSINGGVPLVPVVAALMIAIGGFMFIFSHMGVFEGGPEMLSRGKNVIKAALFGLLIAYSAWLIVNTFFWVIGAKNAGFWNVINC